MTAPEEQPLDAKPSSDAIRARPVMIRLSGVVKHFGANEVLKGMNLAIHKSEVVCIIGPSG